MKLYTKDCIKQNRIFDPETNDIDKKKTLIVT